MGKLYQNHQLIDDLLRQLEPDEETGEITKNVDDIILLIDTLQEENEEIVKYLCEKYKDIMFMLDDLLNRKHDIEKQQDRLKHKAASILKIVARECEGQNKDFGFCTVKHRKSDSTIFDNESLVIADLKAHGFEKFVTVTEKANKTDVKKLLKQGLKVRGARLESSISCSIK